MKVQQQAGGWGPPFPVLRHCQKVWGEVQAPKAGCLRERLRQRTCADSSRAANIQDVLECPGAMLLRKALHRHVLLTSW